jgi:hypothetical protein
MACRSNETDERPGPLLFLVLAALAAALLCPPAGCKRTPPGTSGGPGPSGVPASAAEETAVSDPSETAAFSLHLKLDSTEHSKDRNSEITEISIIDGKVDYAWRYEGFPPEANKKIEKRFTLPQADVDRLIKLIADRKLDRSVSEEKPTDIGRALDLTLEIKMKDRKTETRITGMTSMWGQDGKSNIENSDTCDGARELIDFIKSKL